MHPESIIHGIVEFDDGSMIAQMATPDMRLPIQLALGFPDRLPAGIQRLDLAKLGPPDVRDRRTARRSRPSASRTAPGERGPHVSPRC